MEAREYGESVGGVSLYARDWTECQFAVEKEANGQMGKRLCGRVGQTYGSM